jgi:hypothetical protein
MTRACPTVSSRRSEQSHRTAEAIFSARPICGSLPRRRRCQAPCSVPPLKRSIVGVSMMPGQIASIRMPEPAYSRPADLVVPITPHTWRRRRRLARDADHARAGGGADDRATARDEQRRLFVLAAQETPVRSMIDDPGPSVPRGVLLLVQRLRQHADRGPNGLRDLDGHVHQAEEPDHGVILAGSAPAPQHRVGRDHGSQQPDGGDRVRLDDPDGGRCCRPTAQLWALFLTDSAVSAPPREAGQAQALPAAAHDIVASTVRLKLRQGTLLPVGKHERWR